MLLKYIGSISAQQLLQSYIIILFIIIDIVILDYYALVLSTSIRLLYLIALMGWNLLIYTA